MAFWRGLFGLVSGAGFRQRGRQSGTPGFTGPASATPVTLDSALCLSAVWSCAKLITESIASLPVILWKKNKDGTRTQVFDHPLAILLNGQINQWQTRQEYFETITYQLVLMGNNYSVIQTGSMGQVIGLIPLMSEQMQVDLSQVGPITYTYTDGVNVNVYGQKTIWHNKLFGNGVIGLSPLGYARNTIGIGQGAERAVAKVYQNGGKPSGVLTIDKVLTKEQREAVKNNFADLAEGNQERLFVLEAAMKYQQVSLSPQDIELLASRRFQIEDICRFFGVPSVLVNDTSATTAWGSGIQQIVEGFYKLGLRPYLTRYQDSMNARLLTAEERQDFELEFDFNALLQPDFAARVTTGKEAVTGGLIPPNEWRRGEGLPPVLGGDKIYMQQQMVPIDQLATLDRSKIPATPPEPAPAKTK